MKKRNPVAKAVKKIKPQVVENKKRKLKHMDFAVTDGRVKVPLRIEYEVSE